MSEEKDFEMTIGELRQQKGMKNFGKVFCWILFTLGETAKAIKHYSDGVQGKVVISLDAQE